MTIFELLHTLERALKNARIPFAHLDAETLVACALKKDRSYVLAYGFDSVPQRTRIRARALLKRRLKHEPIAYIRGWQMFYGRRFAVNTHILIPRPETELVIERLIAELPRLWSGTFVDVGTGSGAIAVTLACEFPNARVLALDISKPALVVAQKNARTHNAARRIHYMRGNLLEPLLRARTGIHTPIVMVANLPYVPTSVWRRAQMQVRLFEPRTALESGRDGLTHYRALFTHIKKTGILPAVLWCEIDASQNHSFPQLLHTRFPRAQCRMVRDINKHARLARIMF